MRTLSYSGYGGDAYPGETPEANEDRKLRRHWTESEPSHPSIHNWVIIGDQLYVSDDDAQTMLHEHGFSHPEAPHAFGKLALHYRWDANWQIEHSNIGLHIVERILKKYTKSQGYQHGAILNKDGEEHPAFKKKAGFVDRVPVLLKHDGSDYRVGYPMQDHTHLLIPGDRENEWYQGGVQFHNPEHDYLYEVDGLPKPPPELYARGIDLTPEQRQDILERATSNHNWWHNDQQENDFRTAKIVLAIYGYTFNHLVGPQIAPWDPENDPHHEEWHRQYDAAPKYLNMHGRPQNLITQPGDEFPSQAITAHDSDGRMRGSIDFQEQGENDTFASSGVRTPSIHVGEAYVHPAHPPQVGMGMFAELASKYPTHPIHSFIINPKLSKLIHRYNTKILQEHHGFTPEHAADAAAYLVGQKDNYGGPPAVMHNDYEVYNRSINRRPVSSIPGVGDLNPGLMDWRREDSDNPHHYVEDPEGKSNMFGDPLDNTVIHSDTYECPDCGFKGRNEAELNHHMAVGHHQTQKHNDWQPVVDYDDPMPAGYNKSTEPDWVTMMSKTAGPSNLYHISPSRNRESILSNGLRLSDVDNTHLWTVDDLDTARELAQQSWGGSGGENDIWEIDTDMPTIADPHVGLGKGLGERTRVLTQPVPPEHIRLVSNLKTGAAGVNVPGPIPFTYDVGKDKIWAGDPGELHDDVEERYRGDYDPLGIVRGVYKPNGELEILSETNQPITVSHLIQLWYYMYRNLPVKSVVMDDGQGGKTKLAAGYIPDLPVNQWIDSADPAEDRVRIPYLYHKATGQIMTAPVGEGHGWFDVTDKARWNQWHNRDDQNATEYVPGEVGFFNFQKPRVHHGYPKGFLNGTYEPTTEDYQGPERDAIIQAARKQLRRDTADDNEVFNAGRLRQLRRSNILDPIQPTLDPDVFEDPAGKKPKVKGHIAEWVRQHVYSLMTKKGWPKPDKSVKLVLTGSLTTYQWSEKSDFDVSLFADYDSFPEIARADLISLMVSNLDGTLIPGTTHQLQCYVVPHNISPDHLYVAGLRSGYDLDKQKWIVPPEKERARDPYKELPATVAYAKQTEDKIRLLLKYDPPGAKVFWKNLHQRRYRDQTAGKGDYSESNILYKWLNNAGLFPDIAALTGEYIGGVKTAMPPASQARDYMDDWYQTQIDNPTPMEEAPSAPSELEGIDWRVKPGAIQRIQGMKQFPLRGNVRLDYMPGPGDNQDIQEHWHKSPLGDHTFYPGYGNEVGLHHIRLNPMQSGDWANQSLWHELQHAYQAEEGRYDLTDYKTPDEDPEAYKNHPVEQDADRFTDFMQWAPLTENTDTNYHPNWFPRQYHLDAGEWDPENEVYRLNPEKGKQILRQHFL